MDLGPCQWDRAVFAKRHRQIELLAIHASFLSIPGRTERASLRSCISAQADRNESSTGARSRIPDRLAANAKSSAETIPHPQEAREAARTRLRLMLHAAAREPHSCRAKTYATSFPDQHGLPAMR